MKENSIKKFEPEETKKLILTGKIGIDINSELKNIEENIVPRCKSKDKEVKEKAMQELNNKAASICRAYENDSRICLAESVDERYWGLARELSDQIKNEHNCTTEIEKSLVGVIVGSYIRVIDSSRRLNNELTAREITPNKNKYISILSLQVDRSNRQFLQAITTLKQLKTPSIGINIKTDKAFVAQAQQFNNEKENNETK